MTTLALLFDRAASRVFVLVMTKRGWVKTPPYTVQVHLGFCHLIFQAVVTNTEAYLKDITHLPRDSRHRKRREPQTNIAIQNYTNTGLVEGQTNPNCTQELGSSNFAKEDTGDGDGWGGTYSSHSTICPHEPSNPDNPSCHAPTPPSLNPPPSGSIPEPPGD